MSSVLEQVREVDTGEQLAQVRLLTEVDHLLDHRRGAGLYDDVVLQDVTTNLSTALQEMAMPGAVTTTFHQVKYETRRGQQQRLFMWLGMHAVQVATTGQRFHSSKAALDRVDVEIAEADCAQETLQAGWAQVFISPKMSLADAPREVAKHEHLADEDAVRVSYL